MLTLLTHLGRASFCKVGCDLRLSCYACGCRRDVWADLKPGDAGLTYDGKTNAMLGPRNNIRCLFCWLLTNHMQRCCHA